MEEEKLREGTRAALVSVTLRGEGEKETRASLAELERLLDSAGGVAVFSLVQNKEAPDARTYLGSGKVAELRFYCAAQNIELVVFDGELSPSQIRNLEDALGGIPVIDRSMLILDIFALHAESGEGKLQVELAQLQYTAPRLLGKGGVLSRQGGGIGTRGPGETQLETDKRHLSRRIQSLRRALDEIARDRATQRQSRDRSGLCRVAIVGYTNAGKSTLLNTLTDAGILAEDKLFATLDATTRQCRLPSGKTVLLTDTVGFIRNLPHHLIHAFHSTLDEVRYADLLLVVLDASDEEAGAQLAVTEELLHSLGASEKPVLYVFNKCDRGAAIPAATLGKERVAYISAKTGQGVEAMLSRIDEMLSESAHTVTYFFPPDAGKELSRLFAAGSAKDVEYLPNGTRVRAAVDAQLRGQLQRFEEKNGEKNGER